ncbi:MAG: response regulator, partial [Bdellovibrionales bacterium]|nr:response regulator [Bdellovibrionales bacterium]
MGITIVHDMNKTHNILIVDDEETLLEVTVEILQDVTENIEFIKALNGLEAKKIIEEKKIDMVVTDMQMPKMSGEDLIRYIMDRKLNIPVIIFSAFGSLTEKEAFRLGVKGYFSKPFNYELLVSRISDVLKGNESIDLSENQLD